MTFKNVLAATSFVLTILTGAIFITLLFKPLFYWQLASIDTQQTLGLTPSQVQANYNVLIDYLVNPFIPTLKMPDIAASAQGLFHFHEVKQLFLLNNGLFLVSLGTSAWGIWHLHRQQAFFWFAKVGKLASLVPILLVLVVGLGFPFWFVLFHKVFFNNDAWLFNPASDPIIQVLPESFFLACLVLVLVLVELGFVALWRYCLSKCKQKVTRL